MPDYDLMFRCPKCGWWIVEPRRVDQVVNRETLDRETLKETMFDLKCSFKDCGWTGQLRGSQAKQYLSGGQ